MRDHLMQYMERRGIGGEARWRKGTRYERGEAKIRLWCALLRESFCSYFLIGFIHYCSSHLRLYLFGYSKSRSFSFLLSGSTNKSHSA
jgi:hypothetical protein